MNCREAELLLIDQLDSGLAGATAAAFEQHLGDCLECRIKLQETSAVLQALRCADPGSSAARSGDLRAVPGLAAVEGLHLRDYEILEEIGRGGMAVVYRARQRALNRIVALKILSGPVLSARAIQRFHCEGRTAARLRHPHIVPIHDQGRINGSYYLAMELVEGRTLSGMIADTAAAAPRSRDYRRLATDLAAVADALQHAHDHHIVHRDIKPQNLLVGFDGRYRLADFGLARVLEDPGVTLTGDVLGTPAYMAPEQADGQGTADERSDIYSLGATMYELLTLRRPFGGRSANQLLHQIRTREPRPPRQIDCRIPVDLETICLRAMHKNPRQRFARAGDLADDLLRYCEHRPILSRRTPWPAKVGRWMQRHPAVAVTLAAAVLAVGAGIQGLRSRADHRVRAAWEQLVFQDYRQAHTALELLDGRWWFDSPDTELVRALARLPRSASAALIHVNRVLADAPDHLTALFLKAWALSGLSRKVEARDCLAQADALCRSQPPLAEQWFLRGQAILSIGGQRNIDEAIDCYTQATERRADYPQALLHQARALNWRMYHQRNFEQIEPSITQLLGLVRLRPHSGYPHYLLSIAYRLAAEIDPSTADEHFASALDHARLAQNIEVGAANGHLAEAYCHEARGDYAAAIEHYDLAATVEDHSGAADRRRRLVYKYRWRNHYWNQQFEAALDDLDAAITTIPDIRRSTDLVELWMVGPLRDVAASAADRPASEVDAVRLAWEDRRDPAAVLARAAGLQLGGDLRGAREFLFEVRPQIEWDQILFPYESADWNRAMVAFVLDEIDLATLVSLARSAEPEDPSWLLAQAYFFDGLRELAEGRQGPAEARLRAAAECRDFQRYEYLATLLAEGLRVDPDWPRWGDVATITDEAVMLEEEER